MRNGPAESVVQELLAEVRQLRVENERLRLQLDEMRAGAGRPDPRLRQLEAEVQRLREELSAARQARDELQDSIDRALAKMKEASHD
jgi:chromosome segregation ATPase